MNESRLGREHSADLVSSGTHSKSRFIFTAFHTGPWNINLQPPRLAKWLSLIAIRCDRKYGIKWSCLGGLPITARLCDRSMNSQLGPTTAASHSYG
jgi:hypothetical protein